MIYPKFANAVAAPLDQRGRNGVDLLLDKALYGFFCTP